VTSTVETVEGGNLASLIDAAANQDAASYLASHRPSCHSDTGDALLKSAAGCGDCIAYSPSFRACLFVALVTGRRIFALGVGQASILYRLPEPLRATALSTGAIAASEVGPEWVRFELFRPHWPRPDLGFWTLRAYAAAREWPSGGRQCGP
jgi:hypothetical protein